MHPMASLHQPSTYSIRPYIYTFPETSYSSTAFALFPPTYSDLGSFWPFPFLLFKKGSSQKTNILDKKPRQKKGSALATHFPYAFALRFTWTCSRDHRDQETNLWICPVLQFQLNATLHATFHFVTQFPMFRLQFLFDSHILRTTASLFKPPCLWYVILSLV